MYTYHALARLLALLTVVGSISAIGPSTPNVPGLSVGVDPEVSVAGADATEAVRVEKALERFRLEELALPDLSITFADSVEACAGYMGLFEEGPPVQVTICEDFEFVVTHELAHAWVHLHVTEATKDAYLRLQGLATWDSSAVGWHERGSENAAFVIQQVLMRTHPVPDNELWWGRAAAYELLTGRPAPLEYETTS